MGAEPTSCTIAVFDQKLLLDPTDEEEELSSALITVVLAPSEGSDDDDETVVHLRKAGGEAVSRGVVSQCTSLAKKQGKKIRKMLDKAVPLVGLQ